MQLTKSAPWRGSAPPSQLIRVFYGPRACRCKMTRACGLVIAVTLASAACYRGPAPDREMERVVEAAFRQQLAYWLGGDARSAGTVVCLAVDQGTLPLQQRSVAYPHHTAVRDGSACEARADGAVERSTGYPAVLVTALDVEWIAPDEAWVTIRHYRSQYSSGAQPYRVVRDGGQWVSLGPIMKALPLV
jgi:hypothetical protein